MVNFQSLAAPAVTTKGGRTNHGFTGAGTFDVACRVGKRTGGATCLESCVSDSSGGLLSDCARAVDGASDIEPAIKRPHDLADMVRRPFAPPMVSPPARSPRAACGLASIV